MKILSKCPGCGRETEIFRNPVPTVDIIIELYQGDVYKGIVLIQRKNSPFGWAIPGGFVDYGETLENAAAREAEEETGLKISNLKQFHAYSAPERDPRQHTISYVFTASSDGTPCAADDAAAVKVCKPEKLPEEMAFDHRSILNDYLKSK